MSKGTILSPLESSPVLITIKGQVASVGEPGMRVTGEIWKGGTHFHTSP